MKRGTRIDLSFRLKYREKTLSAQNQINSSKR